MPNITTSTLDSFTFRRDPDTKEITCDCILTARDSEGKQVLTFGVQLDVPPPFFQTACDLAMALHQMCRKELREIDDSVSLTKQTSWLK